MAVSLHNLDEMFAVANEMLHLALEAYEQENLTFAKQIAEMDDSVDEIYGKAIREFISSVRNDQKQLRKLHNYHLSRDILSV